MISEKLTTYLQLASAVLAIPVAAGGSYSVYRNYFSTDVACQNLRGAIITTMEKNIPAEIKRGLLRKDVADFEKKCGELDPDSQVVFQVELRPAQPPPPQPTATASSTVVSEMPVVPSFGLSSSGDPHGWVALTRREPGKETESNFGGYAVADAGLPAVGAMLTARRMLPVWHEPQAPGTNDPAKLQGRVAEGGCVRVLATRPSSGRHWADVTPAACR